jgi:MoaA/NifB/PqqE/SkfB family radical SAM enzyme
MNNPKPSFNLSKLYIEPTNRCNINCRTCIRNVWDEPQGMMGEEVFSKIITGLRQFSSVPILFFGGMGEPLFHPNIIEMVRQAKKIGGKVELITNGTLLTKELSLALINAGLDMLWVSIDGATQESYADVHLGATLNKTLENLEQFTQARTEAGIYCECGPVPKSELGISFVAMKRNITDLPAVIEIARRFNAKRLLVSNVLPYTREMIDETLYKRVINIDSSKFLSLPRIDIDETTHLPLYQAISSSSGTFSGIGFMNSANHCQFIENDSAAINWNGDMSPCLPLLHDYVSYLSSLDGMGKHFSRHWHIGNIQEQTLLKLCTMKEHLAFRKRVQAFDFPFCYSCGGCDLITKNEEDCLGNEFPVCGGCLWAQGVIQCP